MEIKPIKSRKTKEIILEQIKNFIIEGHLNIGDKLPTEMELAEKFQVSRTSVREALSALSLTGILEIRQGEGIFIKKSPSNAIIEPLSFIMLLEKDKIQNILEVRKALEIETAALAAQRRGEQDLEHLRSLIEAMKKDLPQAKNSEKIDLEFHLALAKACKNPLMDRLMNTVQGIISENLHVTRTLWLNTGSTQRLYEEHQEIYLAVADQDTNRARRVMYEHLSKVETELKRLQKIEHQKIEHHK
ncbi:MAG: FadR family transcriptional regulator [Peptococcaceae bacterium]|jgi:GntR family transcriptional repressor for pyruvate dehydrogenase complex|nr:FadR family transcriptional regulator [Peptococcaceae bacterium]